MFSLTVTEIQLLLAVVIPALVALITKSSADPKLKQIVNLALAAVGGWVAVAAADTKYDLESVLISIGKVFLLSVASYFGLKSFVATPIEEKTGTKGIG